ncbi:hypothetical protein BVX95_00155 [archaeon D22]|nr:hypothetical protein BVX95_00155 [archaeon D22]
MRDEFPYSRGPKWRFNLIEKDVPYSRKLAKAIGGTLEKGKEGLRSKKNNLEEKVSAFAAGTADNLEAAADIVGDYSKRTGKVLASIRDACLEGAKKYAAKKIEEMKTYPEKNEEKINAVKAKMCEKGSKYFKTMRSANAVFTVGHAGFFKPVWGILEPVDAGLKIAGGAIKTVTSPSYKLENLTADVYSIPVDLIGQAGSNIFESPASAVGTAVSAALAYIVSDAISKTFDDQKIKYEKPKNEKGV